MGESSRHKTAAQSAQRPSNAVILLALTAFDTTWRTLVPGIAGTLLGLLADFNLHTKPVLTIVGLLLGIALSALLIYQQLKAVKR